ncbi:MAG: gliding motility-associated C-terminal domain-containing protein [Bacteroidota bacterium]|nr:gliding motility-associated C-terminal domain-containing protein [Bacteroidota bacterium]
MMKKIVPLILAIIILFLKNVTAQGTDCATSTPFCTASGVATFPAQQNTEAPIGPNYACLGSQPNPAWFYLQIATAGDIILDMNNSAVVDIDFICWGPFTTPAAGCSSGLTGAEVDCSYASDPNETCNIPNALVGQVYILLITNYSNDPTMINLEQTGGTGATSCGILCGMDALTTVPDVCASANNIFNVSGTVTFAGPPATGILTISNSCSGATQIINAPFNPTSANYTLTGLPANGDTCIVTAQFSATDPNCKLTKSFIAPQPVGFSFSSVTNVLCFGSSTGTATINVLDGVPPYTYLWSPSGQADSTATGLAAGTHTVVVTDSIGCSYPNTITITTAPLLTNSFTSVTNVSCLGDNDGSATASVSGGIPVYTYLWSNSQTSQTITNLLAGTYSLTITDSAGCSHLDSVTITSPLVLSHSFLPFTNVSCSGGNNGSATINVSGGTFPYSYLWSNSQTTQTATGLSAATYTIVVTDANSCSFTDSVTITSPLPLTHSFSGIANIDCFGNPVGAATVDPSGGTLPYAYSWNSIPVQTTQTASTLYGGVFKVTVTDSLGCSFIDSVFITTPTGLGVFSPLITNVHCFGDSSGSATITPFGGTPGYTYLWNPGGQTDSIASGLPAGIDTIRITDSFGCVIKTYVQITEPTLLTSISSQLNILCFGDSSGSAGVVVAGGSTPYTYSWTPSVGTTAVVTGLPAGNYSLLITDSLGCTLSPSFILTQPASPLSVLSSFVDVLCNPDSTGSAAIVVSGGSPGYSYLWSNGQTDSTIATIPAGNYTVMITDSAGCLDSSAISISEPPLLTFTSSQINVLCFGDSSGSASVSVSGGTLPYSYLWNPIATDTATLTGLPAGIDSVLITDAHGCQLSSSFIITQPALPLSLASSFVNVLCYSDSTGSASVIVTGGTSGYSYLWSSGQTTSTFSALPAGNYSLMVTDTNGCLDSSLIIITQPPPFITAISADTSICSGMSITEEIFAAGGLPGYSYLWLPGGTTSSSITSTPIANTTYTVQVSDANGCSPGLLNTTVTVVPIPVAAISVTPSIVVFFPQTICFTADSINTSSLLWNFGDNSIDSVNSVCHSFPGGGTYCVTLLETNTIGCRDSAEVCVVEVEVLIPNVFSPNGDGLNDMFFIDMEVDGITYYKCEIYDRWGLKMTELVRAKQGWSGHTTAGLTASEGTYYFVLSIEWGSTLSIRKEGFLTLVR